MNPTKKGLEATYQKQILHPCNHEITHEEQARLEKEFMEGVFVHEPPIELQVEPGHLALIIKEAEAKLKKEFVDELNYIANNCTCWQADKFISDLIKKYGND